MQVAITSHQEKLAAHCLGALFTADFVQPTHTVISTRTVALSVRTYPGKGSSLSLITTPTLNFPCPHRSTRCAGGG